MLKYSLPGGGPDSGALFHDPGWVNPVLPSPK